MSCNPTKSLVRDAVTLCAPSSKRYTGTPFRPVRAVPVDMFPHTSHCEVVAAFDRVEDPSACSKATEEKSGPAGSSWGESANGFGGPQEAGDEGGGAAAMATEVKEEEE